MTEYNDWKIWNGGECPVPEGTIGQVQCRDDTRFDVDDGGRADYITDARWDHTGSTYDIIAYRTVKEPVAEVCEFSTLCGVLFRAKYTLTDGKVTKVELVK